MAIQSNATTVTSRRALLTGLAGGFAAALAGALGGAQPAAAHDPDDVRLGSDNPVAGLTTITNTVAHGSGLAGIGSGTGYGVLGDTHDGYGVTGHSTTGYGVYGVTYSGSGTFGRTTSGFGAYGDANTGTGVYGTSVSGVGVYGYTFASTLPAVLGWSYGGNTGVQGYCGSRTPPNGPANTGVQGYSDGDAGSVGVRGRSPTGRGGLFRGKLAQLRLWPSGALTHPASGQTGDLFVDKSGRLWYCKGGTAWKQLA